MPPGCGGQIVNGVRLLQKVHLRAPKGADFIANHGGAARQIGLLLVHRFFHQLPGRTIGDEIKNAQKQQHKQT